MQDAADMWIHESFANYAENLFVEYHFTEEEAQDYVIGCRKLVRNDKPIIGVYGVNSSGSGDMYYKGGNMLHTMRHMLDDDARWRRVLRGVNETFWHKTIGTEEFEAYMSRECGMDYSKVFDQYLRTAYIPVLQWRVADGAVVVQWRDVVDGFEVPVVVTINGETRRVTVGPGATKIPFEGAFEGFGLDRNFYMETERQGG
jgi:aminopeptidase N